MQFEFFLFHLIPVCEITEVRISSSFQRHQRDCRHYWWSRLLADPTSYQHCLLLPLQDGDGKGTIHLGVTMSFDMPMKCVNYRGGKPTYNSQIIRIWNVWNVTQSATIYWFFFLPFSECMPESTVAESQLEMLTIRMLMGKWTYNDVAPNPRQDQYENGSEHTYDNRNRNYDDGSSGFNDGRWTGGLR